MSDHSRPDLHHVDVLCTEGAAFDARHRHELTEAQRNLGSLLYGFLRSLYECPDCGAGVYRVSPDEGHTLVCRQCRGVWVHTPQAEAPTPKRRRARKEKGGTQ